MTSCKNAPKIWWAREPPHFVHVSDKFKCKDCHGVLQSPMQSECGHRFCSSCLAKLWITSPEVQCPCGEKGCKLLTQNNTYPDFAVYHEVMELLVYCTFKEFGCKETIPWSKLRDHEQTCPYETIDCPHKSEGCAVALTKFNHKAHVDEECDYRKESCPECKQPIVVKLMQGHIQKECTAVMILCPYKCGQEIQRILKKAHAQVCPVRIRTCKYKKMGCTFQGTLKEIRHHEQTALSDHLEKTVVALANYELKLAEAEEKLEECLNKNDAQRRLIEKCNEELIRLKDSIQSLQKQYNKVQAEIVSLSKKANEQQTEFTKYLPKTEMVKHSKIVSGVQEDLNKLKTQVSAIQSSTAQDDKGEALRKQYKQMDRQLNMLNVHLADIEMRCSGLENTSRDGSMVWKISDYGRKKQEATIGRQTSLLSQPFYTSSAGYKLCARIYPNGDGSGRDSHVSVFIVIMRGEYDSVLNWPFKHNVNFALLDQTNRNRNHVEFIRPDPNSSSFQKPNSDMNIASGLPFFVSQGTLENYPYLVDDTVFIKIAIYD